MTKGVVLRKVVVGAYHVATFPHWHDIVEAQCRRLRESGLLARTSKLLVGVVGDPDEDVSLLVDSLGKEAEICQLGPLSLYEFPTLQWLYEEVSSRNVACWYAHTKGASTRREDQTVWRLRMEAVIFDQHERCLEALNTHDTCGIEWRSDMTVGYRPHYAGNFWWANSRYIRTLPPPVTLMDKGVGPLCRFDGPPALAVTPNNINLGRAEAEFWIGKNSRIRAFNFSG